MVRLAFLLTRDGALAEDLVQDAFVRVTGRLSHLQSSGAFFDAYLRRAVVNRCLSHHRQAKVERDYVERAGAERFRAGVPSVQGPDVETHDEVQAALGQDAFLVKLGQDPRCCRGVSRHRLNDQVFQQRDGLDYGWRDLLLLLLLHGRDAFGLLDANGGSFNFGSTPGSSTRVDVVRADGAVFRGRWMTAAAGRGRVWLIALPGSGHGFKVQGAGTPFATSWPAGETSPGSILEVGANPSGGSWWVGFPEHSPSPYCLALQTIQGETTPCLVAGTGTQVLAASAVSRSTCCRCSPRMGQGSSVSTMAPAEVRRRTGLSRCPRCR